MTGTVGNCLATTPINIIPFWFSTKICHKETFTINKIKVNNTSAKKKCKDLSNVNQNIQMTWHTLLWYPCCQTDVCVQSCHSIKYFKMLGEEKRSMIIVNQKKYPRQIQHPVTDLKMELLAKIVNDLKL